jgi:hypothetical protein
MLTAGSVAGGGFRLVRERPGAVALWALVYALGGALVALSMWSAAPVPGAAANGDPMLAYRPMTGWFWLVELGFFVAMMIVFTAVLRAVLRPAEGGIASLRLGMDELRMIGLALFLFVVVYLGLIVIGIVLALLLGAVTLASGAGTAMVLGIAEACLLIGLAAWVLVRVSLAYPLTLLRGRIGIGEAWRLSQGRFWTLFGGYLIVFLTALALTIAVAAVTVWPAVEEIARRGFTLQSLQAIAQLQLARQAAGVDAMMVIGWLLNGLVGALSLALYGGAMATAARELAVDSEGMAETFA